MTILRPHILQNETPPPIVICCFAMAHVENYFENVKRWTLLIK